jgi:hypothetical protein
MLQLFGEDGITSAIISYLVSGLSAVDGNGLVWLYVAASRPKYIPLLLITKIKRGKRDRTAVSISMALRSSVSCIEKLGT